MGFKLENRGRALGRGKGRRDLELENQDGWIGGGRTGCSRKITGLGVRGSSIHLTNREKHRQQVQRPRGGKQLVILRQ